MKDVSLLQKESATSANQHVPQAVDSSNKDDDISGSGASAPSATSKIGDASESSKTLADKSAASSSAEAI